MLLSRAWLEQGNIPQQAREFLQRAFPPRVIQLGEGNFLRGFVDWLIHQLNRNGEFEGSVVVVAPRPTGRPKIEQLALQDGLFTVWLQGTQGGRQVDAPEVVSSIQRAIDPYEDWEAFLQCAEQPGIDIFVSNTTEAGLAYVPEDLQDGRPLLSFPGKLTAYLYRRFVHFSGAADAGMTILPCELIEGNGDRLRSIVTRHATDWALPKDFQDWLGCANTFCNTLVDRIVTGAPAPDKAAQFTSQLPYEDPLLTIGEPFHIWAIESAPKLQSIWPFEKLGLNVKFVDDVEPFWIQKVRILNGTHTAMAYVAHLHGCATVRDAMTDADLSEFIQTLVDREIVPMVEAELPTLGADTIRAFADSVLERFRNPYLEHHLLDITLNGLSKFVIRLLPIFERYAASHGSVPAKLSASFAAMLLFYRPVTDDAAHHTVADDPVHVKRLAALWQQEPGVGLGPTITAILGQSEVWGRDLNALPGLHAALVESITQIREQGMKLSIMSWNRRRHKPNSVGRVESAN